MRVRIMVNAAAVSVTGLIIAGTGKYFPRQYTTFYSEGRNNLGLRLAAEKEENIRFADPAGQYPDVFPALIGDHHASGWISLFLPA